MPLVEITAKAPSKKSIAPRPIERVLHVLDEKGQPIAKFEVMVHSPSGGGQAWTKSARGLIQLMDQLPPVFDVIVRADGYASVIKRFAGDERDKLAHGEATITIPPGEQAMLRFHLPEGLAWPPNALPDVYFANCEGEARSVRNPDNRKSYETLGNKSALDYNMLNVRHRASGDFSFQLTSDMPPIYVAIHVPGFLQSFEAGPFTAKDVKQGVLTIDVPKPASLKISFDPGASSAEDRPFKTAGFVLGLKIGDSSSFISLARQSDSLELQPLTFIDLPPGKYWIRCATVSNAPAPTARRHRKARSRPFF